MRWRIQNNMCKSFRINFREFKFVLILPIIISLVYLFFQDYKQQLALKKSNFLLWQIYTKDFINDNLNHYLSNLILIFLFSITIYYILLKIEKEHLFKYIIATIILIVPLVSYLSDRYLLFNRLQSDLYLGSSSLASSLMGLFMFFVLFLTYKNAHLQKIFYITLTVIIVPFLIIYFFRIPIDYLLIVLAICIIIFIIVKKVRFSDIHSNDKLQFSIMIFLYLILLRYAYPYNYENI